jgi:hypothetical protein
LPVPAPGAAQVTELRLIHSVLLVLGHAKLLPRGMEVAKAALSEFFLPQFETRLLPGTRPVVTVQHSLDEAIPFRPRLIRTYLGYVQIWLRTVQYLYRTLGESALDEIAQSFRDVRRLYYEAGSVYRRCQSTTTTRVPLPLNLHFLVVYLFDPHLHCVPSLHVLTVCYNYFYAAKVLRAHGRNDGPARAAAAELYRQALLITEATLYVKQHSVLDLAPSLFLLSELFPGYDDAEVTRFVRDLFKGPGAPPPETARRLRRYVLRAYRGLLRSQRARPGAEARRLILEFLDGFNSHHRPGSRGCAAP